jgi:hypothetical protein
MSVFPTSPHELLRVTVSGRHQGCTLKTPSTWTAWDGTAAGVVALVMASLAGAPGWQLLRGPLMACLSGLPLAIVSPSCP